MRIVFVLLFIFPLLVKAQDTIRYENGDYKIGKLTKRKHLKGYWYTYDSTGLLLKKVLYHSSRERCRNIRYDYFANGKLEETGTFIKYQGKHGKWKVYNEAGELILIECYKYGKRHGTTRSLKTGGKVKYRYGYERDHWKNSKSQRYVYYFTYGLPMFHSKESLENKEEHYACRRIYIAGCVVNNRIQRIAAIHDFFVNLRQTIRFGLRWKETYF